jgi:hypothetical protein
VSDSFFAVFCASLSFLRCDNRTKAKTRINTFLVLVLFYRVCCSFRCWFKVWAKNSSKLSSLLSLLPLWSPRLALLGIDAVALLPPLAQKLDGACSLHDAALAAVVVVVCDAWNHQSRTTTQEEQRKRKSTSRSMREERKRERERAEERERERRRENQSDRPTDRPCHTRSNRTDGPLINSGTKGTTIQGTTAKMEMGTLMGRKSFKRALLFWQFFFVFLFFSFADFCQYSRRGGGGGFFYLTGGGLNLDVRPLAVGPEPQWYIGHRVR